MRTNEDARQVVVGYDSSGAGDAAFDWARGEAERLGRRLQVQVARGVLYAAAPGMGAAAAWPEGLSADFVDEARSYVAHRAPGVDVAVESALGSAAALLVDASKDAEVVVVGRHPHSAVGEAFWGSTATKVVAHASCPVIVVDRPFAGPQTAPIVVGVDGSKEGEAALEFGFHRASALGAPIVAVHAWWVDAPDHLSLDWLNDNVMDQVEGSARGVLDNALAPWLEKYPDVPVRRVLSRQYPTEAVLDAAGDAQLLVVGSRGLGGFAGLVLGSVSQGLLHRPDRPCALAVVHTRS